MNDPEVDGGRNEKNWRKRVTNVITKYKCAFDPLKEYTAREVSAMIAAFEGAVDYDNVFDFLPGGEITMNYMEEAIQALQGDKPEDHERWIDSKTGWNNYKHQESLDIYATIKEAIKPKKKPESSLSFTIVKKEKDEKAWAYRTEEAIERLIVVANDDKNICNQYNLGGEAKESIDLVLLSNGEICSLVELKPWRSHNSPAYAFVELVKNFILYGTEKPVRELVLLAPAEYFITYHNESSVQEFFKTIKHFNSRSNAKFVMKYIDLDQKLFEDTIQNIADKDASDWKKVANTEKYDYSKVVTPSKQSIENIKGLLIDNWKRIDSEKGWPKP